MSKIRVGVICGGKSAEHEVSLQSAKNIVDALDRERYEVSVIGIDKHGQWHLNAADDFLLHADDPRRIALNPSQGDLALVPGRHEGQMIAAESDHGALGQLDVIFPIVHGTLGEDGSLQGLLRMANLPFVGSGVLGSAVGMDKDVAKRLLRDAGIPVAPFITVTPRSVTDLDFASVSAQLGSPLFVKPANQGSSVGVSRVDSAEAFDEAIELALSFDHKVLIESAIVGREIECAVLGNEAPEASACGEIVVTQGFYSYDTKYIDDDAATVAVPADIDPEASERIRDIAVRTFQVLECAGLARVDVFLTPAGDILVNEINTLPGFTRISMYPKLWQASGVSYSSLVTRLIELALERHAAGEALKSSR
ncbi:D-alanine--D-alanine ligase [Salinicola rhizosphaerae]|uniref:D-alanine--D-alanine ligase n=1 Tax=Salinicola rhizosphaerae TaxID=1443141 RepID=A0ABQ3DTT4_9GAMM|nr:D-alanine--D-alanine ligase [Salinicola rhizosphaerae]GHB14392.1 D-alanine--D-alanine ligase [Salinicola rhizosphaerae]